MSVYLNFSISICDKACNSDSNSLIPFSDYVDVISLLNYTIYGYFFIVLLLIFASFNRDRQFWFCFSLLSYCFGIWAPMFFTFYNKCDSTINLIVFSLYGCKFVLILPSTLLETMASRCWTKVSFNFCYRFELMPLNFLYIFFKSKSWFSLLFLFSSAAAYAIDLIPLFCWI